MNPELTHLLAQARIAEMHRAARIDRAGVGAASRRPSGGSGDRDHLTLRIAEPEDERALIRLAELDSAMPLAHPVIVAESFGKLVAAVSLEDRRAVADPFEPTAAIVELLGVRADLVKAEREAAKPRRLARVRALLATR